jgi:hypothetical protein
VAKTREIVVRSLAADLPNASRAVPGPGGAVGMAAERIIVRYS